MISDAPNNNKNGYRKDCSICRRIAYCRNYGAITCDACKMFFRRMIIEKLSYTCKNDKKCLEKRPVSLPLCRGCRFQKCLELGMEFVPKRVKRMEIGNPKEDELMKLIKDLVAMESSSHIKLMNFYTEDDLSLEDVLTGKRIEAKQKPKEQMIPPEKWSLFHTYVTITSLMKFDFVDQLTTFDKIILFKFSIVKACLLCSAMRALGKKMDIVMTPDGRDVYPEHFRENFKFDPEILRRICCLLVSRLIELKVTNEEFVLLQLIFFCNPAIPSLSENARSVLSLHQKTYTSALLQYCQLKYNKSAPSRLNDLLSLHNVISRVIDDLLFVIMMFQCFVPEFKFDKIAIDTFQLSKNT